jgi:restriction system protein
MARRRKTSPLEDTLEVVAMLPWWVGVALAMALYLVLHAVAKQPLPTSVQPGQIGDAMAKNVFRSAASVLQYIAPLICLVGAGLSAWRRRERRTLVADVARRDAADALNGMSWQQFEKLVGEAFRQQGYAVTETGGGGADGGIDLVLTRGSEKFLVQCKQWKAYRVSVNVVRELYGVMAAKGAAGGFVVTSGRFTDDAIDFASGRNIRLLDGQQLRAMVGKEQQTMPRTDDGGVARPASPISTAPNCPVCSRSMVRRTSRRGTNAGGEFWGCSAFSACRGTRAVG